MLVKDHPYAETRPFPLSLFFLAIKETTVVDKHTVRFRMDDPYAPLLSNLAYPTGLIISPEAVKKHGKDVGRNPAGTGPYQFREWKSNQHVILDQSGNYWDGQAGSKSVVFSLITDANTRIAGMLSGGIGMMVEVQTDNVATFSANSSYALHVQAGPHLWFLILNVQEGLLQDKRV